MLKTIHDRDISVWFNKNESGGITVTVSKQLEKSCIVNSTDISEKDYLTRGNQYIPQLIDSILDAEDKILKGLP